jgi:hypothetical protein
VRRLLLLEAVLLCACASPDEFSIEGFGGRTNYPAETNEWDSRNVGAAIRLAWDIPGGARARAHEAQIETAEILRHRWVDEQRPAQPVVEAPATASNDDESSMWMQLILALIGLIGAITGYLQRGNIAKGVKTISTRFASKKHPPADKP